MKVTATQGLRVTHDGKSFDGGQVADVPETVALHWVHCGWASEGSGASALRDPRGLVSGTIAPPVEADEQPSKNTRKAKS